MFQKLAILSGLIISASCMVIHQVPIHVLFHYPDNSEYNYAYEVNDAHTGDIKSQHESRRGDVVSGQYSLLQPDGVRRTVDYRADDIRGFRATVNNEGRPSNNNGDDDIVSNTGDTEQAAPPRPIQNVIPLPAAVSRTSIVQTISNSHPVVEHSWI